MDVAEIEKPLDPKLDYFDATPSIEQCLALIQELHGFIEQQLGINGKLLLAVKDLNNRVDQLEKKKSGLILPERMN